jgi:hypothetical protein
VACRSAQRKCTWHLAQAVTIMPAPISCARPSRSVCRLRLSAPQDVQQMGLHLQQPVAHLLDQLPRGVIDSKMTAQAARILIGHRLRHLHPLQSQFSRDHRLRRQLGQMQHLQAVVPHQGGIVPRQGACAFRAGGDDPAGPGGGQQLAV